MIFKRLLSFILSFVLLTGSIYPTFTAYAGEEHICEEHAGEEHTGVFVNPIYADTVTEEDILKHTENATSISLFSEPVHMSYEEAVEYVREAFALHLESVTVHIVSEVSLGDGYCQKLFYDAIEHTETPRKVTISAGLREATNTLIATVFMTVNTPIQ